jgi:hypothetical protein
VIDLQPPELTLLSPRDGAYIARRTEQLRFKLAEASSWSVWLDGALYQEGSSPPGEVEVWLPENLEQGLHHVLVLAGDAAGNLARSNASFVFDNAPPSVELLSPQASSTSSAPISVIEARCEVGASVSLVVDAREVGEVVAGEAGEARFVLEQALGEGLHELVLSAHDRAGNETTRAFSVRVELPMTSRVRVEQPREGALLDARPLFGGVAEPGEKVEVFVGGSIVATTHVNAQGGWQVVSEVALPAGAHRVWARMPGEPLSEVVLFYVEQVPELLPVEVVRGSSAPGTQDREQVLPAQGMEWGEEGGAPLGSDVDEGAACSQGGAPLLSPRRGGFFPMVVWLLLLLALHLRSSQDEEMARRL